ncbi:hypothetical protein GmHk_13G036418 [Glycine max]|nr:hypothetical protein GmHk_13G036418 [Glycine max]
MSDGFCGTHLQIMVRTRGLGRVLEVWAKEIVMTAAHDEPVIPMPDVQDDPMEAPTAVEDIVEVCDDIAEMLERHLSLGVVTSGSLTHEVIEEFLRLARSVTQDHLVYVRSKRRRRTDQA